MQNAITKSDEFGIVVADPNNFPDLESAAVGINVDPKYHEFKDGEQVRGIFCGLSMRRIDGKDVLCAVIQTREKFILNGGVSLVSQLQTLRPGTPVQVTYTGKRSLGEGKRANLFEVVLLKVAGSVPLQAGAVIPSPTTGTAPQPASKPERPLSVGDLKEFVPRKVEYHTKKGTREATTSRGVLATKLESILGGKPERQLVTLFLIGKQHISDMVDAEVMTLLDWLQCHLFSSVPPKYVEDEARAVFAAALEAAGHGEN